MKRVDREGMRRGGAAWNQGCPVSLITPPARGSGLQRIDHLQPLDVAAMAEVFAEEHVTAAANSRFSDQGIKPAELLLVGQLISVEYEMQVSTDHLKAAESVQQGTDLRRGKGWLQFAANDGAQFIST